MDDDNTLGPVARRLAATERVLLIEDEPDIAHFLRAYFRAAGYDLVHVDPDETNDAVEAIAEYEPDLVLLDLRLRGYSGRDVYRRMRSDDRFTFTPVVMVSADTIPTLRSSSGLDAFVAKPFNTNTLADVVRERIDAAKALAEAGRHDRFPLLSQRYLEARVEDEIGLAGGTGQFALALIRLTSVDDIVVAVGEDGLDHLVGKLVEQVMEELPEDALPGMTDENLAAVIFPSHDAAAATDAVDDVISAVPGEFEFPGGAKVPVRLVGGVAGYPTNATTADALFVAAEAALAECEEKGITVSAAR